MPRFGPQPALDVMRSERWSVPALAERINVPPTHLQNAVSGKSAPSSALRDRLPAVLGVPLSRLFLPEALAASYQPGRGPGGRKRPGASWLTTWDES